MIATITFYKINLDFFQTKMNKLKLSLTCSYCSKIFKNPVELPCKHSVCKEHLIDKDVQKQNKIKCVECKQEYQVKDNEFKSVEVLKKLLDEQLYLSEEEISLKRKIEDSIQNFFQLYDEFLLNKTSLDLNCHNHFQELRFQIDEQRENLKAKIDEVALEMIDKTKQLEAKYLTSLNAISVESNKTLDLEIKETEEAFRNPTLLIESIREIQRKQEDDVEFIKLKINELRSANDHLKASNHFKANLSFSQNSFGSLYLNEYSNDPFKSLILTGRQPMQLIQLCEFSAKDKWSLLYRASRDGFEPKDFHAKCDGKSPTLTIFKAQESSYIFGGFTTAKWHRLNEYISDSKAFIFSLTNKDNAPCKMNIDPNQRQHAIVGGPEYGPSFGFDCDIYIYKNPNTGKGSFSTLGSSYNHSRYTKGSNEINSFLAGSHEFQLSEIEVYQKE
jgi:hypothetical protein